MGWNRHEVEGEWGSAKRKLLKLIRSISGVRNEGPNVSSSNPLFKPAPLKQAEVLTYWHELRKAEALAYWQKLMDRPR